MTSRLCGTGLAFLGFAASLLIGLWADNAYGTIITRALAVMVAFYILGLIIGALGETVVAENVKQQTETIRSTVQHEWLEKNPDMAEILAERNSRATEQAANGQQPGNDSITQSAQTVETNGTASNSENPDEVITVSESLESAPT